MGISGILSGVSGAVGLYNGVKGLFDSANAARKQKQLIADAKADESAWFKRNYYRNYLDDTMTRAALKRVEQTLHNQNRQNRAYAAINGATPEYSIARNEQGLRSMENIMTNIASQSDTDRRNVENMHRQNVSALRNAQLNNLYSDERVAAADALGGMKLLNDALAGLNWGRETFDDDLKVDNL